MPKRADALITTAGVNDLPHVLTVEEAAKVARAGICFIYRGCRHQWFPARKVGNSWRIPKDSFLEWLKQTA